MSLDSIVKVNIDRQTKLPSQKGFGVPAIISPDAAAFSQLVTTFNADTALEELIGLGVTTASQLYKLVSKMVSQNPKVEKLKVIKQTGLVAQVSKVQILTVASETAYVITLDGVDYTYTSDIDATQAEILAGLIALINPLTQVNAVANGLDALDITSTTPGQGFSLTVTVNLAATSVTANNGPVEDLMAAREEDDDWYFLLSTVHTAFQTKLIAGYIETVIKVFGAQTDEADSKNLPFGTDTTSLLKFLNSKLYDRTFPMWVGDLADYKLAAIVGLMAPKDPGSATWKFKEPNAVSADKLTSSEKKNIQDKKGNVLTTVAGFNIFEEGVMASGEFIDIIVGTDFLQARIQENVFGLLVTEDKVPFTDGGIQAIGLQVEQILELGVKRQILVGGEDGPKVTLPKRSETQAADRANRFLRDVKFSGFYAGAVHKVQIDGTLSI